MTSECPICRRVVAPERPVNPCAPFCSARCRAIDLGRWLGGEYRIPALEADPSEPEASARGEA